MKSDMQSIWVPDSGEQTLQQVLAVLSADWFKYDELCPNLMWLIEVVPDFLSTNDPLQHVHVRRVFLLDHMSLHQRSVQDWFRFHTIHFARPWDGRSAEGRFVPSISLLEPRNVVYAVGWAYFSSDSLGGTEIALWFGPRYGRGYHLTQDGTLSSLWVS